MKTAMRKKYRQKRALFKNKSEKRDLQLIKYLVSKGQQSQDLMTQLPPRDMGGNYPQ